MFGCALPRRTGATPETNAFWAWLTSADRVDAEQGDVDALAAATRTGRRRSRPTPRSRASRDASTLTAPRVPVMTSLIATPTLVGLPPSSSAAPVIDIRPLVAWMTKS